MKQTLIKAEVITFTGDPYFEGKSAFRHIEKGAVAIEGEKIAWVGEASQIPQIYQDWPQQDFSDHILTAGFVDCHLHYPQTRMIGAFGSDLLYWLNTYTFPEEARYKDPQMARRIADVFLKQLTRNGITTCSAFSTVHPASVDALFEAASAQNRFIFTGKVMMDRNAIPALQDTPQTSYDDSLVLAKKWHEKGRNRYIISPRFAITSTEEQLEMAGQLAAELPECLIQTHINESAGEIAYIKELFPNDPDYLGVYERFGLINERVLLGHSIHNTPREIEAMSQRKAKVVHCPTSNNFLGSGLFNANEMRSNGIDFAFGCDIGGGTTFSTLATMGEAYKVGRFHDISLSPIETFYLATLGGARLLNSDHEIGKVETGYYADLVLLDPNATELMQERTQLARDINGGIEDILFSMQFAEGMSHAVKHVWIAGQQQS